jgi:hypothetical protein
MGCARGAYHIAQVDRHHDSCSFLFGVYLGIDALGSVSRSKASSANRPVESLAPAPPAAGFSMVVAHAR